MQLALKCFRDLRTLSVRGQAWCPCISIAITAAAYRLICADLGSSEPQIFHNCPNLAFAWAIRTEIACRKSPSAEKVNPRYLKSNTFDKSVSSRKTCPAVTWMSHCLRRATAVGPRRQNMKKSSKSKFLQSVFQTCPTWGDRLKKTLKDCLYVEFTVILENFGWISLTLP